MGSDDSVNGYCWLTLSVLRCMCLVTWIWAVVVMQYHLWFSKLWKDNPLLTAVPEQILIAQAFYMMLATAVAMWFVDNETWAKRALWLQVLSVAVAGYHVVRAFMKLAKHMYLVAYLPQAFAGEKLQANVMRALLRAEVEKQAAVDGLQFFHNMMKPSGAASTQSRSGHVE